MKSEIYWIDGEFPGRIALVPRPRGGDWLEDEVRAWKLDGIGVVVSMLEYFENAEFELLREAEECRKNAVEFFSVPVPDRDIPRNEEMVRDAVAKVAKLIKDGRSVVVHCRQSVGRAPLFAALLMSEFGVSSPDAFERIGAARGVAVPETEEQRQWVEEFVGESIAVSR